MFRTISRSSSGGQIVLIPVGTAIIIVVDVKYACVLTSILTANIWCAHTNPSNPITITEKTIHTFPNSSFYLLPWQMICEITPNPGRMRM